MSQAQCSPPHPSQTRAQVSGSSRVTGNGVPTAQKNRGAIGGDANGVAEAQVLILSCAVDLWKTQRLLLGAFHPDCAQSLYLVAITLQVEKRGINSEL